MLSNGIMSTQLTIQQITHPEAYTYPRKKKFKNDFKDQNSFRTMKVHGVRTIQI